MQVVGIYRTDSGFGMIERPIYGVRSAVDNVIDQPIIKKKVKDCHQVLVPFMGSMIWINVPKGEVELYY